MVVFSQVFGTGTIVRISQDGSFVQKRSPAQTSGQTMQIASNGDGYLLLWNVAISFMIRLDNNGDVVPGSELQATDRGYEQVIGGIGGFYLLVGTEWQTFGSACVRSIRGRMVSGSGVSAPFVIHDSGGDNIKSIAVSPDSSGFQVVWMKRLGDNQCGPALDGSPPSFHGPYPPFGIAQVHVGLDGGAGTASIVAEGSGIDMQPAVARNASAQLVIWIEASFSDYSTRISAAISHAGEPLKPIAIALGPRIQTYSALAASENTFMAVWSEKNPLDDTSAIYARRFSTDGHAIDAEPIKVSDDQFIEFTEPEVAFDGGVWLFIWLGVAPGTSARRLAADGTWIDAVPFQIGPSSRGYNQNAVVSNGNGFAFFTFAGGRPDLTLIPRTGEPRQLRLAVSGITGYTTQPSIAWDGSTYVAVWPDGSDNYLRGIRFDQDRNVLTPLFTVHRSSALDGWPSVACHAGACVVAWQSDKSIAAATIIGSTVVPFNTMIDASIKNASETQPTVLATQDGFQLFWTERGSGIPSLFTAAITPGGIGPPTLLGEGSSYYLAVTAAITTHGAMGLTLVHPASDAAGVKRAFLRVWPETRRRAVGR